MAVVLHTTFLAARWLRPFERWRARSSWIGELGVPVLALPQDDYDHADVLDEWLEELGATDVFTPFASAVALYPRTRRTARFHQTLTGYVDDDVAERWNRGARPLSSRPTDVVYRATRLPYWYGRVGQMKYRVGVEAARAAARLGLSSDISTSALIVGDRWFEHLASGRTVVGCESGSSVLDHRGEVRRQIQRLLDSSPRMTFDDLTTRMPAGWDDHWFTALSPRHLEAAVTRTAQVLLRGRYSDVLVPERHYIPFADDYSDLGDALLRATDPEVAQELTERAHAELVESRRFSYERLTAQLSEALPAEAVAGGGGAALARLGRWAARAQSSRVRSAALLARVTKRAAHHR